MRKILLSLLVLWTTAVVAITPASGKRPCVGARVLGAASSPVLAAARGPKGNFETAPPDRLAEIERRYRDDKARVGGLEITLEGKPERFRREHLDVNLDSKTKRQVDLYRESGLRALAPQHGSGAAQALLEGTAYDGYSPLHHFTSGAGLWSRGGGTVKGLLPLNLKEILSTKDFANLVAAGDIVAAKGPADVLRIAGEPNGSAEAIVARAQETIKRVTTAAMADPRSVCAIDMKLVNVAMLSRQTKAYVHFDVWTSSQTHAPIHQRFEYLKANYDKMTFHPDAKTNATIRESLRDYFAADQKLGETHLFGYQIGVYPLNPTTGASITTQTAIGEGAGMAKRYLNESGRTAMLLERGVRDWSFHNIEIVTDVGLEYSAYRVAGKPVAAVLVPTQKGYSGGSPYLIRRPDGSLAKQLVEGSAVSAELREGNDYFNTNSIYQSIGIEPPENVGYEVKDNGTIVRLKMNAGDVTLSHDTAMVGGRLKKEYENFKTYGEYGSNGDTVLREVQTMWGEYAGMTSRTRRR